jgi:hypothetical protein
MGGTHQPGVVENAELGGNHLEEVLKHVLRFGSLWGSHENVRMMDKIAR